MLNFIKNFRRDEDGAVTVDWVVLTAAIVGLSVGLIALIGEIAVDKSTSLGAFLAAKTVVTY
ncbi:MAG: hypothetical protein EBT13_02125 [Rhodobacteraceae bacterium]|nr:hypothetical protein [Paracoccaceae bacterium]